MAKNQPLPWTLEKQIVLVRSWIIIEDDIVVTGLPYLMYGSLCAHLENMLHYELSHREYRIKKEVKSKFNYIRTNVKIFNKIYHKI